MKQKSINIAISLFILFIISFLVSLLLSVLYMFNLISINSIHLSINITGVLIFLLAGGYLGLKLNNRILIHALIIMTIYLVLSLICHYSEPIELIHPLGKAAAYCIGSLIGRRIGGK